MSFPTAWVVTVEAREWNLRQAAKVRRTWWIRLRWTVWRVGEHGRLVGDARWIGWRWTRWRIGKHRRRVRVAWWIGRRGPRRRMGDHGWVIGRTRWIRWVRRTDNRLKNIRWRVRQHTIGQDRDPGRDDPGS
jgi:hypothetical protein